MRLFYLRDPLGNFGDDLNPLIWNRYLPDLLDLDDDTLLLGIGTILHPNLPRCRRLIVMGSGTGYGDPPRVAGHWEVRFVRGPLTAQALGLAPRRAITDPAILVADVPGGASLAPSPRRRTPTAFMPHHLSARYLNWRKVCRLAGYHYLDPTTSPAGLIRAIRRSRLVITEALHGAIAADALRIPWIGVAIYPHINRFKWHDWFAAMELAPRLRELDPLLDRWTTRRFPQLRLALRATRRAGRIWPLERLPPVSPPLIERCEDASPRMAIALHDAASAEPMLSRDSVHRDRLARVQEEIHRLRQDEWRHRAGTEG